METKDILNYRFSKNTFVKIQNGDTFRVSRVDFDDSNQPIRINRGDDKRDEWLNPSEVQELFEQQKPTIAELPYGTRFKYRDGTVWVSVSGAGFKGEDGDTLYAIQNDGYMGGFISREALTSVDYELID
tara:strand:- start:1879 stop:2265 length:387 start_codon:yes stop_codon:yes gene_type:complete